MAKKENKGKPFKVQGWKSKEESPEKSTPATEDGVKTKKRGNYEEKVAVDISFEDLIKLTVTDVDKPKVTKDK